MNPAFFDLPPEKRRNLLAAGYRAFALYPYAKASMAMVAQQADISKALLFYYFRNKQEYYLYLFDQALAAMADARLAEEPERKFELFHWVALTVEHRMGILKEYPYLLRFATRAYYETDPHVQPEVCRRKQSLLQPGVREVLRRVDLTPFRDAGDAEMLLTIILCLAEGCMRGQEELRPEGIRLAVRQFHGMLASLRARYYRPEFGGEA